MKTAEAIAAALLALGNAACGPSGTHPASLNTRNDTCRFCRMPVSDARLAAQVVAPGEEALFFDDIGCLRDYLRQYPPRPGSLAYVADHRTGAWVEAAKAVFARCPALATPMSSHLIAYSDARSLGVDAAAAGCRPLSLQDVFGPAGPPSGGRRTP